MVNNIKKIINPKHEQASIDDLSAVFIILLFMLFISIIIFVIELFYYKLSRKNNVIKPLSEYNQQKQTTKSTILFRRWSY